MNYQEMQDVLTEEIEGLSKLRDRLSPKGDKLSIAEKGRLRRVFSGAWLEELNSEALFFFQKGMLEDFEHSQRYIVTTLKSLV